MRRSGIQQDQVRETFRHWTRRMEEETEEKPHICHSCYLVFDSNHALVRHRASCLVKKNKYQEEVDPGVTVLSKGNSNSEPTHTDLKNQIAIEPYGTVQNTNIKDEELEREDHDSQLYCNLCCVNFTDLGSFLNHQKIHKSGRRLRCSLCGEGVSEDGLRQHLDSHWSGGQLTVSHIEQNESSVEDRHVSADTSSAVDCEDIENSFDYIEQNVSSDESADEESLDLRNGSSDFIQENDGIKQEIDAEETGAESIMSSPEVENGVKQEVKTEQQTGTEFLVTFPGLENCVPCDPEISNWIKKDKPSAGVPKLKKLQCEICFRFFTNRGHLTRHKSVHDAYNALEYDLSSKTTSRKYQDGENCGTKGTDCDDRPYQCSICGKTFAKKKFFSAHMLNIHTKLPKNYVCPTCGMAYVWESGLEIHMRRHTGEKPFVCEKCGRGFITNSNLRKHMTSKKCGSLRPLNSLPKGDKKYGCEICSKSFRTEFHLRKHVPTHTNNYDYKCDKCNKQFLNKFTFQRHQELSGALDGQLNQCDVCDQTFCSKRDLASHKNTHTNTYGSKFKHMCSMCGKCFSYRSHLTYHTRVHTGEKPFVCGKCGKAFVSNYHRMRHMKVHGLVRRKEENQIQSEQDKNDDVMLTSQIDSLPGDNVTSSQ